MAKDDLDSITGLPEELDIGGDLARADQRVRVSTDTRRYGKAMTIVEGFGDGVDLKSLASELKRGLATGGTVDERRIELQGDHRRRVADLLEERGFDVDR